MVIIRIHLPSSVSKGGASTAPTESEVQPIYHSNPISGTDYRACLNPKSERGVGEKGAALRRLLLSLRAIIVSMALPALAIQGPPPPSSAPARTASTVLLVPVGSIIPLEIKNTINSHSAYVGEAVYCETLYPVTANDRLLIPAHSYVKGSVAEVIKPGHIKGKAQLSLRIDSITLPDGTTRPLQATILSLAGSRLSASKAEEESAEPAEGSDIAVSGSQDAIVDASGLGGGSPISAVSEGVGGLVVMLMTRGKTIILRPGTTLEIQLTAPLRIDRSAMGSAAGQSKAPPLSHRPLKDSSHAAEARPNQM